MKCPNCGNEVGREEAFCGLCGNPMRLQALPTEMVNIPPSHNGLLSGYNTNLPSSSQNIYQPGTQPPVYNAERGGTPTGAMPPGPLTTRPIGPLQQGGFYQDATEAMNALPHQPVQNYPALYPPPQGFVGTPVQGGYAGQYAPPVQPFQTGLDESRLYSAPNYTQPQLFPTGHGIPTRPTPPPVQKQNNAILIIACICLGITILTVATFGVIYLTRNHPAPQTVSTPTTAPTTAPTATAVPSPTSSPTATTTPTPTPSPSPTISPTPTPDANFSWCQSCVTNGFSVEFPNGWQQQQTSDNTGIEFLNPVHQEQYAAFKTAVPLADTASDLIAADLQNNFSNKTGYMAPTGQSTATIGGENWVEEVAYYQPNDQKIQVQIYATIHQGKPYIIELQAFASEFTTINTQYYEIMFSKFQFQGAAH